MPWGTLAPVHVDANLSRSACPAPAGWSGDNAAGRAYGCGSDGDVERVAVLGPAEHGFGASGDQVKPFVQLLVADG